MQQTLKKHPPEVFYKKGVLKNFAKFTGKHLCESLFFNKVAIFNKFPFHKLPILLGSLTDKINETCRLYTKSKGIKVSIMTFSYQNLSNV